MCGGLRSYLRVCGHDAAYVPDRLADGEADDDAIAAIAREEDRRLITRDVALAGRTEGALLVESRETEDQLRELRAAGLELEPGDPARCGRCNGRLDRLDGEPDGYVPDDAEPVWACGACGQQFWKGSHWDRMRETLERL
jgi:hypothetical protein